MVAQDPHPAEERRTPERAKRSGATAIRVISLLSAIMTHAVDCRLVGENPCRGVDKVPETSMENFLTPEELSRLLAALAEDANRPEADAVQLLAATGCRRTEVFGLTWDQVAADRSTLRLRQGETKKGHGRLVLLNDIAGEALERAEGYRQEGNPHVFPAANAQGRVLEARRCWARCKRRAKVDPKVRLHDRRHSVGSLLGQLYPTAVVAQMLGHRDHRVPQRYIHVHDQTLREAADAVSRRIGDAGESARQPVAPTTQTGPTGRQVSAPVALISSVRPLDSPANPTGPFLPRVRRGKPCLTVVELSCCRAQGAGGTALAYPKGVSPRCPIPRRQWDDRESVPLLEASLGAGVLSIPHWTESRAGNCRGP